VTTDWRAYEYFHRNLTPLQREKNCLCRSSVAASVNAHARCCSNSSLSRELSSELRGRGYSTQHELSWVRMSCCARRHIVSTPKVALVIAHHVCRNQTSFFDERDESIEIGGGVSSVDYWQSRCAHQRAAIVLSLVSTLITAWKCRFTARKS
jgi:hypothetical protein